MAARAVDVADFILAKLGPMPAMKLQKLVYYSQAWHLVWSDAPLFGDRIEAWANGPVVPALYSLHRLEFVLSPGKFGGNPEALSADEADSVNRVIEYYGGKSSQWLSDLTHNESPWQNARVGLASGERGTTPIELGAMAEYYGSL